MTSRKYISNLKTVNYLIEDKSFPFLKMIKLIKPEIPNYSCITAFDLFILQIAQPVLNINLAFYSDCITLYSEIVSYENSLKFSA